MSIHFPPFFPAHSTSPSPSPSSWSSLSSSLSSLLLLLHVSISSVCSSSSNRVFGTDLLQHPSLQYFSMNKCYSYYVPLYFFLIFHNYPTSVYVYYLYIFVQIMMYQMRLNACRVLFQALKALTLKFTIFDLGLNFERTKRKDFIFTNCIWMYKSCPVCWTWFVSYLLNVCVKQYSIYINRYEALIISHYIHSWYKSMRLDLKCQQKKNSIGQVNRFGLKQSPF